MKSELTPKEKVKQRLEYHFRATDGDWVLPEGMPFMKEFLNEIEALLNEQE